MSPTSALAPLQNVSRIGARAYSSAYTRETLTQRMCWEAYTKEGGDGTVNLIGSGVCIQRSHETGEYPIAEIGLWHWLVALLSLEEFDNLGSQY